ncbi:zinc finger protein 132-like [Pteronotus mesoamericanus]|uniref:zinc finger protein 132-like n=1 Tax=Pteronotus mesoamericanus TaxID=1884717 RepID=UPI0023EBF87E|nr:zinc finger protein 132-like [Pteronotus parnellii mesoamericanus]
MLENLALVALLGCWCGVEETLLSSMSCSGPTKAAPSNQRANPCDICGLVLQDTLHLADPQGIRPRQTLCKWEARGKDWLSAKSRQHRKQHSGEKAFTCRECREHVWGSHDLFQLQATHSEGKPRRSPRHREPFLPGSSRKQQQQGVRATRKPFKCSGCRKAFPEAFAVLHHPVTPKTNPSGAQ